MGQLGSALQHGGRCFSLAGVLEEMCSVRDISIAKKTSDCRSDPREACVFPKKMPWTWCKCYQMSSGAGRGRPVQLSAAARREEQSKSGWPVCSPDVPKESW